MPIKVVALDVYGTILARDDYDDCFPPRKGLCQLFDNCLERGIKVVTISDGLVGNVRNDLVVSFRNCREGQLCLEMFDGFFQMQVGNKELQPILECYGIQPDELLVVGDDPLVDICAAKEIGARFVQCPVYEVNGEREWTFDKVNEALNVSYQPSV